jgi:hypothetical protein
MRNRATFLPLYFSPFFFDPLSLLLSLPLETSFKSVTCKFQILLTNQPWFEAKSVFILFFLFSFHFNLSFLCAPPPLPLPFFSRLFLFFVLSFLFLFSPTSSLLLRFSLISFFVSSSSLSVFSVLDYFRFFVFVFCFVLFFRQTSSLVSFLSVSSHFPLLVFCYLLLCRSSCLVTTVTPTTHLFFFLFCTFRFFPSVPSTTAPPSRKFPSSSDFVTTMSTPTASHVGLHHVPSPSLLPLPSSFTFPLETVAPFSSLPSTLPNLVFGNHHQTLSVLPPSNNPLLVVPTHLPSISNNPAVWHQHQVLHQLQQQHNFVQTHGLPQPSPQQILNRLHELNHLHHQIAHNNNVINGGHHLHHHHHHHHHQPPVHTPVLPPNANNQPVATPLPLPLPLPAPTPTQPGTTSTTTTLSLSATTPGPRNHTISLGGDLKFDLKLNFDFKIGQNGVATVRVNANAVVCLPNQTTTPNAQTLPAPTTTTTTTTTHELLQQQQQHLQQAKRHRHHQLSKRKRTEREGSSSSSSRRVSSPLALPSSSSSPSGHNYIEILPVEICLHIFSFLSSSDLCLLSSISKSFKLLVEDNQLWKTLCYQDFAKYEQERLLVMSTRRVSKHLRDPTAPKKNLSSYLLFCQDNRAAVRRDSPKYVYFLLFFRFSFPFPFSFSPFLLALVLDLLISQKFLHNDGENLQQKTKKRIPFDRNKTKYVSQRI